MCISDRLIEKETIEANIFEKNILSTDVIDDALIPSTLPSFGHSIYNFNQSNQVYQK